MTQAHETAELIRDIADAAVNYQPNERVTEVLQSTKLAMIIGPMAVGKDTCIRKIESIDPKFHKVRGFTTREPRFEGEEYHFWGSSADSLARIYEHIRSGDLAQYVIHPTLGVVYGSEAGEYSKPYSVLDTLYSVVESMRLLPFGDTLAISLTVEPEQWQARLMERSAHTSEAVMQKRLEEAKQSLEWSLDQGSDGIWVVNSDNGLDQAAQEVIGITRGTAEPNPAHRHVGARLLKRVIELQVTT